MRTTEKILIVEDEKLIRMTLGRRLRDAGYQVLEADHGAAGLEALREGDPDLMLLDYRLPDVDGIQVLERVRREHPDVGVILMTAHSTVDNAVAALKLGAYDYLKKPINLDDLLAAITKALETTRLRREIRRLRGEKRQQFGLTNIIGQSAKMQDVFTMIHKVADSAASTVLLQGASGTGKDLVAKAIHYSSTRADRPFMNITCSALPETLLESELFGHERGAFTDAKQSKNGLLELADGGTVFLDEIGDMGLALQAKLLRFLEEKSFKRVGGTQDIKVDVRIIAATNRDLERAASDGSFREDLYYRLNVIPIRMPSLRERKEDIPLLIDYFIDQFNTEFKKSTRRVSPEMLECMIRYEWPGNVRELRNVIERAMILEDREQLDLSDLPPEIASGRTPNADGRNANGEPSGRLFGIPTGGVSLQAVERDLVQQALETTAGNQTHAARMLRISRDALRYKMKKFGLF